jgi:hypothetical protein
MRLLRYGAVAVAGIVAGLASAALLAVVGLLALQVMASLSRDPSAGDSYGWFLVFTWPIWLALLLGAGGFIGVGTAFFVHKKLPGGGASPDERAHQ